MDDSTIRPRSFSPDSSAARDPYLAEESIRKIVAFFSAKGVAALKEEDSREQWYPDWLDYQAEHRLYASVLSPKQYSSLGHQFDLLKLTRVMEVFGYFSPSHGYSLQVSFLGLFPILMGPNESLKREAVATLEAGGLFALGISEKEHGADLLSNMFRVTEITPAGDAQPRFVANGSKYYIGNSNCASIVSVLARRFPQGDAPDESRARRLPFIFVAIRPARTPGYRNVKKIRTLGVRAAYVGELEVKDYPVVPADFIADGRTAWDAAFGTVTLGKFFLGFGSIGICEHAMVEAVTHLRSRMLYRKSALAMPHLKLATAQAYARLFAMKLYAYRALDYLHAARSNDRRYQLFCAVQKAKVSTQGVKVIAQLSECMGAKGFEADTYFESALRDAQLIPGLEGSTHINLGLTMQFMRQYFAASSENPAPDVKSLSRGDLPASENWYLFEAKQGRIVDIAFAHFLNAYKPYRTIPNVRRFVRQVKTFARLVQARTVDDPAAQMGNDLATQLALGECTATIAYAQLIAENAALFHLERALIAAIFHLLVIDLGDAARTLAALPDLDRRTRRFARQMMAVPMTAGADWDYVAEQSSALSV